MAVEGIPFIAFSGFATLVLALAGYGTAAVIGLAVTGFVTWFFRDPCRTTPAEAGCVVAPADGKVIQVREVDDREHTGGRALRISIFMNVFNVHVNRIPCSGTVRQVSMQPGKFYAADKDKAVLHNERCALLIETADRQLYGLVQVAGLIARRIVCRAETGDQVARGQRYGLIRFGSRVDLYLPVTVRPNVREGEKVRCGETIVAFFPGHPEQKTP